MKLYPKDATSAGEKALYIGCELFAVGLYLFLFLSAFGLFNNFYATACKDAGFWWKIPGLISTAVAVWFTYLIVSDAPSKPSLIGVGIAVALSIGFYCGFGYPYIF